MRAATSAIMVLAALAMTMGPARAQTRLLDPAWLQNDSSKEEGQGIFLRGANGCFLMTAAHVLEHEGDRADTVSYRVGGGPALNGTVRWAPPVGQRPFDIGVVEAAQTSAMPACPDIPGADKIGRALDTGRGEILLIDQGGERSRIPVVIVRETPQVMVSPISADDQVQRGFSGAPLLVDGLVIGLVSDVDNRTGTALIKVIRLDAAPLEARNWLAPPGAAAAVASPAGPQARKVDARRQLTAMGQEANEDGFLGALGEGDRITLQLFAESGVRIRALALVNNFDRLEALPAAIPLAMAERQSVHAIDSPENQAGQLPYWACGISWSDDVDFMYVGKIIHTPNAGLATLMRSVCNTASVRGRWAAALRAGEDGLALISDAQGRFSAARCAANYGPIDRPARARADLATNALTRLRAAPQIIPDRGAALTATEAMRLRSADPNYAAHRRAAAVEQSCPQLAPGHARMRALLDSASRDAAAWPMPK